MSTDLLRTLLSSLEAEIPQAVLLRERLHASPEPSHGEHETARLVTEGLGSPDVSRVAGTGLVARAGPDDLPTVAVRAELDALPVREETGAPFAATNGLMHACGHDIHMAALAALLRAARRVGGSLPKPLLALYQPSEEAHPLGADLVVREGTLDGAAAVVAAHVHPEVPWGAVSVEPGPVNASLDFLRIVVEGAGGHGAYPHRVNDPIFALSSVIVALQSLVSRRLDPMHPGVLSIGWTRAGTTENVIPSRAEAGGTLRVLEPADRVPLRAAAREVVENVARAHGCSGKVEVTEGEPATVNDPDLAERARSLLDEAGFDLAPAMRSCGSDDFGFYGRFAPELMVFVGIRDAPGTEPVPLHHPRFLPPEGAVEAVARAQAVAFAAAAEPLDPVA
jgi:amidohydrolase